MGRSSLSDPMGLRFKRQRNKQVHTDGRPIRGTRSRTLKCLPNIAPGTHPILTAFDGKESRPQTITTL